MKSMIVVMSLLLALTVYASFADSVADEQQRLSAKADLAESYAHGQPLDRVQRFVPKQFDPDSLVNDREEDLVRTMLLGIAAE